MENNENFKEGVYDGAKSKKIKFFFKGPENDWHETLDDSLVEEIETQFCSEMRELGYLN